MLNWFRLIGLRAKTIAVVELEYGRKLDVAGGADTPIFNKTTRSAQAFGGNEYDAAAMFVTVDHITKGMLGLPNALALDDVVATTIRLTPQMAQPLFAAEGVERALEAGE